MKNIIHIVLIVLFTLAIIISGANILLKYTNKGKEISKNWETNVSGTYRHIEVINSNTGDTLWDYYGKCYISNNAEPGNITVVYSENGYVKKADFIGDAALLIALEH